jgi:hypothetical protein
VDLAAPFSATGLEKELLREADVEVKPVMKCRHAMSYGGQRPILATTQPSQSRLAVGWMGTNDESRYTGQRGSWFLRMSKKFHWIERICTASNTE